MPRLAMRTPHHGRQHLPRVAERLEGDIEPIAKANQGIHGHRRIPCLPHHRDQLWEPDLLGIAGSHTSPLPSHCLLDAARSHMCHGGGVLGMWRLYGQQRDLDGILPRGVSAAFRVLRRRPLCLSVRVWGVGNKRHLLVVPRCLGRCPSHCLRC